VVLAAGKGTRMKSDRAKVLHELCGRPLAYYPVRRALEAGASSVVGWSATRRRRSRPPSPRPCPTRRSGFALQREQLGTAHAVLAAQASLGDHAGRW